MTAQNFAAIPASATIGSAESIAEVLKSALAQSSPIVIDCDAVEDADISFIQLVLAARQSAKHLGKDVELKSPASGALRSILVQAGLVSGHDAQTKEDRFWQNIKG